jgi:hypothetical protein
MQNRWFANRGQVLQLIFAAISASVGICVFLKPGNFLKSLPPWATWGLFGVAIGLVISYMLQLFFRTPALSTEQPEWLKVQDIQFDKTDRAEITYKRKLRIVITNVSGKHILIGPGTNWTPDNVPIQPLPHPKWQMEGPGGWHDNSWAAEESLEIHLRPNVTTRIWIGLHMDATEDEVRRNTVTRSLGTLIIPIKVDGTSIEHSIHV